MLSLENVKKKAGESEEAAIARWIGKVRKAAKSKALGGIVGEPKLDGLSVSLRYEAGSLAQGATRGDGTQGDDITENARVVEGVVHRLPEAASVEVRGEVVMRRSTFEKLKGSLSFASARNAAAGSLRQQDAATTRERGLSFVAHDVVGLEASYSAKRETLAAWGFAVAVPHERVKDDDDDAARTLAEYHRAVAAARGELEFDVDGVVYKVESQAARDASGATAKAPRWAIAHKFDSDAAVAATALRGVRVSVGKSGALTPIAELDPVKLGDVEVRSASLHNVATLREVLAGVRLGDPVLVRRAGDVIPQVVGGLQPEPVGRGDFEAWDAPDRCPSCATPTVRAPDGEKSCPAAFDCDAQAVERLAHFVSRRGLDLGANLGKKKIKQLVEANITRTGADLLELVDDDATLRRLEALDGWATKSATKLIDSLDQRRQRPLTLAAFLSSLGVPRLGKSTADLVARTAGSWDTLWQAFTAPDDHEDARATRTRLAETRGIGVAAVDALRAFALDRRESAMAARAAACLVILDAS
ncbi:hypothetical protein CTAYLR_005216 [Chrysophaeum taylorii]|uniref:DNA ligase (NAD(+)) n=1 Tax=Chrysophaeum taylorii TaxID=2483200 RepID=A0AAD7UBT7_9STRA|nr:hypothetical protein CTAYLR_005216 [Chrysophaeum taylorii]